MLTGYSYDQLARRTEIRRGNNTATSFVYDTQQRLGRLSHDLSGVSGDVGWNFSYNEAGQIRNHSQNNSAYAFAGATVLNRVYTPNGLNQYSSIDGVPLSYDRRGNLTGRSGWSYSYDSENRLIGASSGAAGTTLAYDAVGRLARVTSSGASRTFLYDGEDLVGEYDGAGALVRRTLHGPSVDEPAVVYEGGVKKWLYADHLGSVAAAGDTTGNALTVTAYGPYGETQQTPAGRFGYTGQVRLPEIGLYYYKARFYSAEDGRFLQTDPIGYEGGTNLYAYVGNDPVNFTDPFGLTPSQSNDRLWDLPPVPVNTGRDRTRRGSSSTGRTSTTGAFGPWNSAGMDFGGSGALASIAANASRFAGWMRSQAGSAGEWFNTPTRHDISGTSICWKACGPGLSPVQIYSPKQQLATAVGVAGITAGGLGGPAAFAAGGRSLANRMVLSDRWGVFSDRFGTTFFRGRLGHGSWNYGRGRIGEARLGWSRNKKHGTLEFQVRVFGKHVPTPLVTKPGF
jgi:RHS repeat-associated protein